MKKILIFALTLLLLLSCVPIASFAQEETTTPKGTPISTVEEFENMDPTGIYYLANDINFEGKSYENYILESFNGTLDGNGKAIYGFSIVQKEIFSDKVGIFKEIATTSETTVKNLKVGTNEAKISVTTNDDINTIHYVGTLAGIQTDVNKLTIENVAVYTELTTNAPTNVAKSGYIGGIIGYGSNVSISSCKVYGTITGLTGGKSKELFVGGVAGILYGGTIVGCTNFANINVSHWAVDVFGAGILGQMPKNKTVSISDCVNFGTIGVAKSGNRNLSSGGLAGILALNKSSNTGIAVNNCINYGKVNITAVSGLSNAKFKYAGIISTNSGAISCSNCVNYGTLTSETDTSPETNRYPICPTTFTDCYDKTGAMSDTPATGIKTVGFQQSEPADGKFNIRFIATVDTNTYETYGFEGTAYMLDGEGKLITGDFTKQSSDCYTSIDAYADKGLKAYEAGELGGNYLIALSISNIPTATEAGTVTIVYRTFATDTEGNTVYGNTITVSFRDGVVVNHIDLSK